MIRPSQDSLTQQRELFDRRLSSLRAVFPKRPERGWIKHIREMLCMRSAQLAKRLSISQSVVSNFEKAELSGSITLRTLSEIAEALECDLVYAFVPKDSLNSSLEKRAKKVLQEESRVVDKTMALEEQGAKSTIREGIEAAYLITSRDRRLWE